MPVLSSFGERIKPRATAQSIIQALGGNPNSGMCCCPAHDDNNPSLHVTQSGNRVLLKCHTGCSQDAVIDALRVKGLWSSGSGYKQMQVRYVQDNEPSRFEEYERFRKGYRILRRATQVKAGPPLKYLNARGIRTIPESAMLLPANETRRLLGKNYPAMVFPIINGNGLAGAQVTLLSRDETKRLKGWKRTYGSLKGGYVPLGEINADKPLIVGEGIEFSLSASQIAGVPAIASLGAPNLKTINPPPCSEIIIAADNDDAGSDAAQNLVHRLKLSDPDRIVRIAVPDGPEKYDWNDALRSKTDVEELRRSILQAIDDAGQPDAADDDTKAAPGRFESVGFPKGYE